MKIYKIKSFAKVNLALHVTGKLSKFHKIESIVSFVNLHDLIFINLIKAKDHKISFLGKFSKNIGKNNTVSNLLNLLDKKEFLNNKKFKIKILKNIPQKAGLGGGSMNASAVLNFLIKKNFLKIGKKHSIKLTKLIGSDVSLGMEFKDTILSSNGSMVRFKKKTNFYTLIVKPNFGCSTKYIFSKCKYFSNSKLNLPNQSMFKSDYLKNLNNDLEVIAFKRYPKLKKIKSFLSNISNLIFVRMSGSGSSIVAYFHSEKACNIALKQFKRNFNSCWCITSKTI